MLHAELLFDGTSTKRNQSILVEDGRVVEISQQTSQKADYTADIIAPGFIDTQVNGGGGKLFNNSPQLDTLKAMLDAHRRCGTLGMFPTVITDDTATMQACADAVAQGKAQNLPGLLGIHFEGPHLSVEKKGIHPSKHIRALDKASKAIFARKDIGTVIVTIAPETVSVDDIHWLVEQGVIVSIGHTNASYEQTQAALDAGATGFTHLFNAMSGISGRMPGAAACALTQSTCYAGIIADLHHVHSANIHLAHRCLSDQYLMLVTDAMSYLGSENHTLEFNGEHIVKQADKLTLANGTLAGSALDMLSAVRKVHIELGIDLSSTLKMASSTPANFTKLSEGLGYIGCGQVANLLALNKQLDLTFGMQTGRLFHA